MRIVEVPAHTTTNRKSRLAYILIVAFAITAIVIKCTATTKKVGGGSTPPFRLHFPVVCKPGKIMRPPTPTGEPPLGRKQERRPHAMNHQRSAALQLRIMDYLASHTPAPVFEIAAALDEDPNEVLAELKALETMGRVFRKDIKEVEAWKTRKP